MFQNICLPNCYFSGSIERILQSIEKKIYCVRCFEVVSGCIDKIYFNDETTCRVIPEILFDCIVSVI